MNTDSDYYDKSTALDFLAHIVHQAPSQVAWCQEKGVSPQQLSDLLNGRKILSGKEEGKIFEAMGIKETLAEKRKVAGQIVDTHKEQCDLLRVIQSQNYVPTSPQRKRLDATMKTYHSLQEKYAALDEKCPIEIYFKWKK